MTFRPPGPRRRLGPPLRFPAPRWQGLEGEDPFRGVFNLHGNRRAVWAASLLAALLYGGSIVFALVSPQATSRGDAQAVVVTAIPVITTAPVPPPKPLLQPAVDEPAPPPRARVHRAAPAAAQASQVLTQRPDSAPADFSAFVIATGHGDTYAGGYTAGKGTSREAISAPSATAAGRAPPRAAPSQARAAEPIRRDWTCAWPDEAQESDLHETRVAVRVQVSPDGEASAAEVEGQTLPGFAEAARRCALGEQYRPALDAAGRRVAGQTTLLVVHFVR